MKEDPLYSESESGLQEEIKKDKSLLYTGLILGSIIVVMAYLTFFVEDINHLFGHKAVLQPESGVSSQLDENINMNDTEVRGSLTKFIEAFYYDQRQGYFDPPSYFANITETYYNYHNLTYQRLRDLHYKRLSEMRNLRQNWIVSSLDFKRENNQRLIVTYWVRVNYLQTLKNAYESADIKNEMIIDQDGKIVSLREVEVKNFSSVAAEIQDKDSLLAPEGLEEALPDISAPEDVRVQHAETGGRYEGKVYDLGTVETSPEYPGGQRELIRFIAANVHYPAAARLNNIHGRVYVSFIVERNGDINGIQVIRGIGGGCDEEAIRVLRSTVPWKPGTVAGKPVRTAYTIPVNFKLNN